MRDTLNAITNKIKTVDELVFILNGWRLKGDRIVFTNGCFDILHKGHATYLAHTSSLGNRLIIGLNKDGSVKRLKGDNRPINNEEDRALMMASLHAVDAVILFDEDTPINLIKAFEPDVLVKGGDYDPNETNVDSPKYIVGSDIVKANGGEVSVIQFVDGYSTTKIINNLNG